MLCNPCATSPGNATSNGSDLPVDEKADHGFPRSAVTGFDSSQLEGLAAARSWGFESPLPHHHIEAVGTGLSDTLSYSDGPR